MVEKTESKTKQWRNTAFLLEEALFKVPFKQVGCGHGEKKKFSLSLGRREEAM